MKKILVAMGNFKDTYTSVEMCNLVGDILKHKYEILKFPICDGGESTYDVLRWYFNCEIETAEKILDARLKFRTVKYLKYNDEVYITSYDIIRLIPEEDSFRNPLELSDYGLGQVVLDAINKGYKKINLCIGGTSTVGCGIGFAQALGADIYMKDGSKLETPIITKDLVNILNIKCNKIYSNIKIKIIADGMATYKQIKIPTELKISKKYETTKKEILKRLDEGIKNIVRITNFNKQFEFSGSAGCLYFGINLIFYPVFYNGADYFLDLFQLESKSKDAEMVLTGEGRLDNIESGKAAIKLSKRLSNDKKIVYICGQIDKNLINKDTDDIDCKVKAVIGTDEIIVLQKNSLLMEKIESYESKIYRLKKETPMILKNKIEELFI